MTDEHPYVTPSFKSRRRWTGSAIAVDIFRQELWSNTSSAHRQPRGVCRHALGCSTDQCSRVAICNDIAPRYTSRMAIAIRRDAAEGNMRDLVKRYQEEGRPYITMTCLVANSSGEYIIYHEVSTEPRQLRTGFATYLERDHPNHPLMYEIDASSQTNPNSA